MTPTEKYSEEKDELKNARKNRILAAAFQLFSEKGIDTIAMTDIAKTAEIGVASLYRYYETKDEIAIRTAIWAWEKQKEKLLPALQTDDFVNATGINQIKIIFDLFILLFEENKDFFRFIYFFDSYAIRQKITKERLSEYETTILYVQSLVAKAIEKGIMDKSINSDFENKREHLYFTLMHTFFDTCQKMTLSLNMLEMNSKVPGKEQLELLSTLLIKSLK